MKKLTLEEMMKIADKIDSWEKKDIYGGVIDTLSYHGSFKGITISVSQGWWQHYIHASVYDEEGDYQVHREYSHIQTVGYEKLPRRVYNEIANRYWQKIQKGYRKSRKIAMKKASKAMEGL